MRIRHVSQQIKGIWSWNRDISLLKLIQQDALIQSVFNMYS